MIDQKNGMDPPTTEPHPPENEVDFVILWSCTYPKFGNDEKGGAWCMRGEYTQIRIIK